VFLAWLGDESGKPIDDIGCWLRDLANERFTLVVSAVVCAEVLDTAGSSTAGTEFREHAKRGNIIRADATWQIAEMAAIYRERVREALSRGEVATGIKAPDALILATANKYRAHVLHTFDPPLLALSGSPLVDGLKIEPPLYPEDAQTLWSQAK
jgi:predicted nucleic acid-binding protein